MQHLLLFEISYNAERLSPDVIDVVLVTTTLLVPESCMKSDRFFGLDCRRSLMKQKTAQASVVRGPLLHVFFLDFESCGVYVRVAAIVVGQVTHACPHLGYTRL